MLFVPNEHYTIYYHDGEVLSFTVISDEISCHERRVKIHGSVEETRIHKLLAKQWKTVERITPSVLSKNNLH